MQGAQRKRLLAPNERGQLGRLAVQGFVGLGEAPSPCPNLLLCQRRRALRRAYIGSHLLVDSVTRCLPIATAPSDQHEPGYRRSLCRRADVGSAEDCSVLQILAGAAAHSTSTQPEFLVGPPAVHEEGAAGSRQETGVIPWPKDSSVRLSANDSSLRSVALSSRHCGRGIQTTLRQANHIRHGAGITWRQLSHSQGRAMEEKSEAVSRRFLEAAHSDELFGRISYVGRGLGCTLERNVHQRRLR